MNQVGLAEGTFYPAVHTVLGGWYTKAELGKRACIFFSTAFVGSMFSGYLVRTVPSSGVPDGVYTGASIEPASLTLWQQAALYTGMDGTGGLSGWRWLFIFDGIITFPMALWGKS